MHTPPERVGAVTRPDTGMRTSCHQSWENHQLALNEATKALSSLAILRLTDRRVDVGLEDLGLVELLVPVSCDPYLTQRALLSEDNLGIEHGSKHHLS